MLRRALRSEPFGSSRGLLRRHPLRRIPARAGCDLRGDPAASAPGRTQAPFGAVIRNGERVHIAGNHSTTGAGPGAEFPVAPTAPISPAIVPRHGPASRAVCAAGSIGRPAHHHELPPHGLSNCLDEFASLFDGASWVSTPEALRMVMDQARPSATTGSGPIC